MADESNGKGKGKASAAASSSAADGSQGAQSTPSSTGGGVGGGAAKAAQTLSSALRSSMASSQLASVMQNSSGKEGFQVPSTGGGAELRDWLVQDLRSAAPAAASGSASSAGASRVGGFRSNAGDRGAEGEKMFDDFQRGLALGDAPRQEARRGGMEESWTAAHQQPQQEGRVGWQGTGVHPATARAVHSYTELDEPLHASVRNDHAYSHAQRPPPAASPLAAQSNDIFALLDAEQTPDDPEPSLPTAAATDPNISHFDEHYRPPSPSHPSFTREQAALHLALADEHASLHGRQELLIPRPDNPALREGVYAPTPQQALEGILGASGRQESSEETETEVHERGREVVRKITRFFGATSYVDDVYGVSPVLRETIEEVVRRDTSDENRAKAVRRLESLWGHLSGTRPEAEERGAGWVDSWLLKNT
ncbi:conserved hypothetical protein [Sporisorium reilianum SRZ2]|uniref:Uncharacterized protein n=1 Tax=Sporisorium reilianum (strain SRZ2) TaxID=999809 RepID=E6ZUK7_SPORE|nr:conserved hypothetical protein [Sporisorium reilianum SRZ2]